MCGIAGYFNFNDTPSSLQLLEKMKESLLRRGPDQYGYYEHQNVGMVHTRLSIIDISN